MTTRTACLGGIFALMVFFAGAVFAKGTCEEQEAKEAGRLATAATRCNEKLLDKGCDAAACAVGGAGLVPGIDPILPKTGQTTCWNTSSAGVTPCGGTGQDGDVQAGQTRSFNDHGDGTITDEVTGLMWEVKCGGASCPPEHDKEAFYTFDGAFSQHLPKLNGLHCSVATWKSCTGDGDCPATETCSTSGYVGYNDWRVPNLFELQSLVNLGTSSPATYPEFDACAADCDVTTCSCIGNGIYWSSSTVAYDPFLVWVVGAAGGDVFKDPKNDTNLVRAVRGGL